MTGRAGHRYRLAVAPESFHSGEPPLAPGPAARHGVAGSGQLPKSLFYVVSPMLKTTLPLRNGAFDRQLAVGANTPRYPGARSRPPSGEPRSGLGGALLRRRALHRRRL